MSAESVIATKYAKALLELACSQHQAEQVHAELMLVANHFSDGDGRQILTHPLLPLDKKMQILKDVLKNHVSILMVSFLKLLLEKRRGTLVGEIARIYELEWMAEEKRRKAIVTTAVSLTDSQFKRLQTQLTSMCQQEVELEQIVDADLQAGARVEMGDLVFDGTLQARLARLRRALTFEN